MAGQESNQPNQPGEPSEPRRQSVARDTHDALPFHRYPHGEADDPHGRHTSAVITAHSHEHPGELTYIKVAIVLAAITAVEVAIYYILSESVLVPTLIVLSLAKFIAVVGYFMHLKFDDRRYTWVFVSGLVIALSVFLGTAAMFLYHKDIFDLNLPLTG